MQTGPKASSGFDLALTELLEGGAHEFLVEAGSEAGAGLLAKLLHNPATPEQIALAEAVLSNAAAHMGRSLDTEGLKERLQANPNHPRWDETAERCLACGNCTMVCPTCFCTTVEDRSDLNGTHAERVRKWDSCFTLDFSYIHGGSVRNSAQLAIPAVDDPQARELVRSIRHLRLRWLRPLHHLVPGRHRHNRRGRRHQGRPGA